MTTVAYPLRIPQEIIRVSRLRAEEERVDQSTALRQFLYVGVEEYVLSLIAQGRITIGKATELLDVTIYDIHRLAQKHGIVLGATDEQMRKSRARAQKIF